jgi:uncharacterized membrane protein YccF (DUF307 family)
MTLLGNIIWFFLGGFALFLLYGLAAIIFFPAFIPLFRLARYSAWPFGRGVVTRSQMNAYREMKGLPSDISEAQSAMQGVSAVLNVLWLLTFGWIIAVAHLVASLINLCMFFLVITIPNIVGNWKLMPVALMPFNKVIVPKSVEDDIRLTLAKAKLKI